MTGQKAKQKDQYVVTVNAEDSAGNRSKIRFDLTLQRDPVEQSRGTGGDITSDPSDSGTGS